MWPPKAESKRPCFIILGSDPPVLFIIVSQTKIILNLQMRERTVGHFTF